MKHGLKRLCGAGALVLPLSVLAQQPVVDDLTGGQSNGFYSQTEARQSSGGTLTLLNQMRENQQQIQQLRGQVEELRYRLDQLREQSQKQYLDLDDRLANSSGGGYTDSPSTSGETPVDSGAANAAAGSASADSTSNSGGSSNASASTSSSTDDNGNEAYQAAFEHVQSRRFAAAIDAFNTFIGDYPQSSLVPNAHYWLGELHSAQSELDEAADEFQTVISDYPQSNKVSDSLYKLGLLKARQGDSAGSRELLERVRRDHPDSSAAQMADDFLNQMGS